MRHLLAGTACALLLLGGQAAAQPEPAMLPMPDVVHVLAPAEGSTVIDRRPEIQAEFTGSPPVEMLVTLDGTDITPLIERTPSGFRYKPPASLASGPHQILIATRAPDGSESQTTVNFFSRHGETLREATSRNELSYVYDVAAARHGYPGSQPTQRLEGTLRTDSAVKTDNWQVGFSGTVRHLDQNRPIPFPLEKGVDVAGLLLSVGYNRDLASAEARLGDLVIHETGYTVANLARRGGDVTLGYDKLRLHLFNVAGQQHYGLRGNFGLQTGSDRNVAGASLGWKLLDDRVEVKAVTATGGEEGSSYSVGTIGGAKKGSVVGGQLNTNFFRNLLRSEFEIAHTRFDADRSDGNDAANGKAWRAKLGGFAGTTSYDAQYEYVGSDFTTIGNLTGIVRDREGVTGQVASTLGAHAGSIMLSRYEDNVDDDPTRATLVNYQGGVDYSYGGWAAFPVGLSWQKTLQQSEKEPAGVSEVDFGIDTVGGRLGFISGNFRLLASASGSWQEDSTPANNDGTIEVYQLTPSYGWDQTLLSATVQLTRTALESQPRNDLLTTMVDMRSAWLNNRLTGEMAGTVTVATRTGTTRNMLLNSRLAYLLPEFWGGVQSSVALRGSYNHWYDRADATMNRDELALFVVLATTVPVIW